MVQSFKQIYKLIFIAEVFLIDELLSFQAIKKRLSKIFTIWLSMFKFHIQNKC